MDEIIVEFLTETQEGLDQLDNKFVMLEQNPDDRDTLAGIFRTIHTIKGTCGFLGFSRLEKLTHAGENLLSLLRDGKLYFSQEMASALLNMLDAVRVMVGAIEQTGSDGEDDYAALIGLLNRLKDGDAAPAATPPATPTPPTALPPEPTPPPVTPPKSEEPPPNDAGAADGAGDSSDPPPDGDLLPAGAVFLLQPSASAKKKPAAEPATPAKPAPAPAAPPKPATPPPSAERSGGAAPTSVADSTIRVDVPLLDKLMNLVGELVLARNQIVEYTLLHENSHLTAASQRLNLITSELQTGIMRTRMQPISNIWAKIPRVVRDLALSSNKQVRVEMEGKETELDKSLIEAMKDPLTHLIRNAVDHGVELPEARRAAGKPEEGCLLMRAYHEGGQVHIEIADNGAGIDPQKLRRKSLEKGIITQERAATMTDQDFRRLIFMAGFSTAEKVTNISGRGVGMDVVKTNIEKIGGVIDLESELGKGTTFKIRIPLTLAIVPALIITTGGERFAIPQVNLLELIRVNEEQQKTAIEYIHDNPVYRLRGKLLPIVYLNRELELHSTTTILNIVVLQAGEHQMGLVVDQINDTQEIVVKPLDKILQDVDVFAGATIMGDGRVALILDILGIAQQARILNDNHEYSASARLPDTRNREAEIQTLLLVSSPGNGRLAIPLGPVSRLEEFDPAKVENIGAAEVIQYRGQILPLVQLWDLFGERRPTPKAIQTENGTFITSLLQVIVFGDGQRRVGLIVEEIIDIVQDVFDIKGRSTRTYVSGTVVIQNRVTELFDVPAFLQRVAPLLALVEGG